MQQSVEIGVICRRFFCYCHHTFHENSSFTGKAEFIIRLKNSYLNIFDHLSAAEGKTAALAPIAAASFFLRRTAHRQKRYSRKREKAPDMRDK